MSKSSESKIIPNYGDITNPNIRAKYGYLEAIISIIGNILIFLIKLFLGIFINSIALIADGFHSLSDVSTSGVVIFGFTIAKKKGLKLQVTELQTAKDAQNAPSLYGTFSLIYNRKLLVDHYISSRRFENIISKEIQ